MTAAGPFYHPYYAAPLKYNRWAVRMGPSMQHIIAITRSTRGMPRWGMCVEGDRRRGGGGGIVGEQGREKVVIQAGRARAKHGGERGPSRKVGERRCRVGAAVEGPGEGDGEGWKGSGVPNRVRAGRECWGEGGGG